MRFAHKQIAYINKLGVDTKTFMFDAGTNLYRAWVRAWELRRLIQEYRPDIIHAQYGSLTAFVCAVTSRVPLVINYGGSDLNSTYKTDGLWRSTSQVILSHLAALRASTIICVSRDLKNKLRWRNNIAVVIPRPVDLNLFKPMSRTEARKHLGWIDNERIVLFNANNNPKAKGLELAEASIEVIKKNMDHVRFEILRKPGGKDTPSEDIPYYLNAADCLLVTSPTEGSPNIVKEALACNLPIVSVNVGDVSERLHGVQPSRIVPRDITAIGLAITEIILSGQRSNGREHVSGLSPDRLNTCTLEIYRSILERNKL